MRRVRGGEYQNSGWSFDGEGGLSLVLSLVHAGKVIPYRDHKSGTMQRYLRRRCVDGLRRRESQVGRGWEGFAVGVGRGLGVNWSLF